jgi:hypothetical protein
MDRFGVPGSAASCCDWIVAAAAEVANNCAVHNVHHIRGSEQKMTAASG